MRARFLGKDPESDDGDSATLYATDRAERKTYLVQGWNVTDPEVFDLLATEVVPQVEKIAVAGR